jgi:hypothetical protein
MSLERAEVNCERCYELAESLIRINGLVGREYLKPILLTDNDIYAARNEDMKALEYEKKLYLDEVAAIGAGMNQIKSDLASEALSACRNCDYSSPKIVDTIRTSEED